MTRHWPHLAVSSLFAVLLVSCRSAPPAGSAPADAPRSTPAATSLDEPAEPPPLTTALGRTIRILDSDEGDIYDDPIVPLSFDASSDTFAGKARKAAKLSLLNEPFEGYETVQDLWTTLDPDDDMIQRKPPISHSPKSRRVAEERRNVEVDGKLCAASREDDNDFHLIVCDDPDVPEEERYCLNVEISGLPASGSYLPRLRAAREQFVALVGGNPPGHKYRFYDPCIPVRVRGPLFYDIDHPPGTVGPAKLRPDTAWEIHPIESIEELPEG